jgi:mannose-6-phosphate isomerase-like protein (cupin superfamily)
MKTTGDLHKYVILEVEAEEFVPNGHVQCISKKLLMKKHGATKMSILRSDFERGGFAAPHAHDVEQAYYILEGFMHVRIGDNEYDVGPNTIVYFPPKVIHSLRNTGDGRLSLLAINAPPL